MRREAATALEEPRLANHAGAQGPSCRLALGHREVKRVSSGAFPALPQVAPEAIRRDGCHHMFIRQDLDLEHSIRFCGVPNPTSYRGWRSLVYIAFKWH